jgi:hypothetical protein
MDALTHAEERIRDQDYEVESLRKECFEAAEVIRRTRALEDDQNKSNTALTKQLMQVRSNNQDLKSRVCGFKGKIKKIVLRLRDSHDS